MKRKALAIAFRDTLPVMTGYLFLGIGFGVLLHETGYGTLWSVAMGLFIYAGSAQYLTVSLLASGASLASAAVATLLVNARHLFYGISLVDAYKTAGKRRFYMIFGLTDETYSLVTQAKIPEGLTREDYCFWVTLLNHCYWVAGCVLGAVVGSVVPIDFSGVSFVLTALFVTIFVEQWLSSKDHFPALVGVVCTALSLLGFGSELFLIPAMAAIALILILRRRMGKEDKRG